MEGHIICHDITRKNGCELVCPVHKIMYSLVLGCDIPTLNFIYNMQANPHILIAEFHRLGNLQSDY